LLVRNKSSLVPKASERTLVVCSRYIRAHNLYYQDSEAPHCCEVHVISAHATTYTQAEPSTQIHVPTIRPVEGYEETNAKILRSCAPARYSELDPINSAYLRCVCLREPPRTVACCIGTFGCRASLTLFLSLNYKASVHTHTHTHTHTLK